MKKLLVIMFVGLALRLLIAPSALHVDLLSLAEWGERIFFNGPQGFYDSTIWTYSWPTQPPIATYLLGINRHIYFGLLEIFREIGHTIVRYHLAPGHMRWWFSFTIWFDRAKFNPEVAFPIGYIVSMKLLAMLSDIAVAVLLYITAKRNTKTNALLWPVIYLASPFTWYISSLWGQTDNLAYLPLLVAFLLEANKRLPVLTPFLFALSVGIKPTALIFIPLFVFIYIKNRHSLKTTLLSLLPVAALFWFSTQIFTSTNPIIYSKTVLFPKIFLKAAMRLSTNSFNFWRIFIGNGLNADNDLILGVQAKVWGWLIFGYLHYLAIKQLKKITTKNVVYSMFIIGAGGWLFMASMLDRYFFAGVASGLFACIFYPKLLKYWLGISFIFWLNLFHGWWFPDFLKPLAETLKWQEGLVTRGLALINVILFIKMLKARQNSR